MAVVLETYLLCNHPSRSRLYGKKYQASVGECTEAAISTRDKVLKYVQEIKKHGSNLTFYGSSGNVVSDSPNLSDITERHCIIHPSATLELARILKLEKLQIMAIRCYECNCKFKVQIAKDGKVMGRLFHGLQFNNKDGKLLYSAKLLQSNNMRLMYINNKCLLVEYMIKDLESGKYDKWKYVLVPDSCTENEVAEFWLGKKSQMAILWRDGTYMLPTSKQPHECLAKDHTWNVIQSHSNKEFIICGYKTVLQKMKTDFFLVAASYKKPVSIMSTEGPTERDWLQMTNIIKVHQRYSCATYLATSVCDYIHIFQVHRSKMFPIVFYKSICDNTLGGYLIDKISEEKIDVYIGADEKCVLVPLTLK